jgi:hypothetical protein
MMPMPNIVHWAVVVWFAFNAGLIVKMGEETDWRFRPLPVLVSPPVLPSAPLPEPLRLSYSLPNLAVDLAETSERPLFVPTRRGPPPVPPEPPPPAPPAPTMQRGQFQLLGTIIVNDRKIAVLFETAAGKARNVAMGGEINGVLLKKVDAERVLLAQYGETEEVVLKVQPSRKSQPSAVRALQPGAAEAAVAADASSGAKVVQEAAVDQSAPKTIEEIEMANPFIRALRQRTMGVIPR